MKALRAFIHGEVEKQNSFHSNYLASDMKVKEAKDAVPQEHVETFFDVFSNRLYEIPHSVRPEIVRLLR